MVWARLAVRGRARRAVRLLARASHLLDDALHGLVDAVALELAFPNGDCKPAELFEFGEGTLVALDVAAELRLPKLDVFSRHAGAAIGAAMPVAPVDKDRDLAAGKGNVGAPGRLGPVEAVPRELRRTQALAHKQLGFGIAPLVALHGLAHRGSPSHQGGLGGREGGRVDAVEQVGPFAGALLARVLWRAGRVGGGRARVWLASGGLLGGERAGSRIVSGGPLGRGSRSRGLIDGGFYGRGPLRLLLGAKRLEELDQLDVGRHPFERRERLLGDPAQLALTVASLRLALALGKTTEKAVHGKVKAGVVVLKRVEVLQPGNANLQLLEELALACLRRGLAVLHLSAWEFPQAVHVPVPSLNCKDLSAIALDDARGNVNGFHGTPSRNHLPGQIGRRAFCFSQATLHECNSSVSQIDGCAWWLLRV